MKATTVNDEFLAQVQTEPIETGSVSTLQSLANLRRSLLHAKDAGFSIFIAVCNQPSQRIASMQALQRSLPGWNWASAEVKSDSARVLAAIRESLESSESKAPKPNAIMLVGLEQAVRRRGQMAEPDDNQPVIEGLNLERDAWRKYVPIPVVLWTSDFLLPLLARHAPDLLDWRSGTVLFPLEASADIEVALDEKDFDDHLAVALSPEMRRARLDELEDRIAMFDEGDKNLAAIQAQWLEEAAGHAIRLGEPARAEELVQHALKVWRSTGPRGEAETFIRQGEAWLAAGDLVRARDLFRTGLVITERLARQEPINAQRQRDLSVAHNRLGDVQLAQGDLVAALASFREVLEITECLVRQEPSNAERLRDLSVSRSMLGGVQLAQGDLSGALVSFRTDMEITERLARQDPNNAQWLSDLGVTYSKLGDVQRAQGDLDAALASFRKDLEISEDLARKDPSNARWQSDFGLSHSRLGDVQLAQGDLAGALASFRKGMEIAERLAKQDFSNADWQRDLCVSYVKLAEVLERTRTGDGRSSEWWQKAHTQLSEMKRRGVFVSPQDEGLLQVLRLKTTMKAPEAAPQR